MEAKTYTNRTNARRAGVAAGVPSELVQITVHKNGDEVRFGWKAKDAAASAAAEPEPVVTTSKPKQAAAPKVEREERNGVKRPRAGGACAAVWEYLDQNGNMQPKDLKPVAAEKGWNENNALIELYQWRRYMGHSGRAAAK
ncbi:hypothetical protein L0Z36_15930 [Burkholderia multivorans]|uniref:hypothetical protein n=1 Tax=Burkholderia multivorans TaxID=87883 RepID=UPI0020188AE8|nr:hypothetical protein [Burkholderia multivorans]UQP00357.1 hypothetical protein L0Z36_15930 [Burkholderia multivorans]